MSNKIKVVDLAEKLPNATSGQSPAEKALEEASRMATVVRDSNDAITIQDFEGRITAWNRGAERMYGYSEAEALAMNIELLTAPGKIEEQQDFVRRLLAGEEVTSLETQRLTQDGRVLDVWMTVTKLVDEAGTPIGIASTERDITESKRALEEASRMATVVRDSNDAITIQDFEGRITAWNRGAERMYGYSEAEALAMDIELLTAPGKIEEQKDFVRRLVAGEAVTSLETQRLTKDGRVLDVWMTVTKLVGDAGTPIGIASTERDITERKLAEVELEAVNHELEAFSYSVSHDLKAPLRAVDGFTKMLEEDYADRLDDEGRRLLKVVRDSARDMGRLVNDLLAFSRLSRKDLIMTQLDLGRMAEDACRQAELDAEGRTIRWEIGDLPPVFGDEATIREVLHNLFANAVKFTRPRAQAVIGFAGHAEAGEMVYTVTDNGVGFDMTYKAKLFDVFQRLHTADEFEGTGIGLALVQRIIKRHGGRVWAEGEVNKGARFYFTLPRDGGSGNDPKKTEERK